MSAGPPLTVVAWISVASALLSGIVIAVHELRCPQRMAIMNVVWPLTALYFGPLTLIAYFQWGQQKEHSKAVSTAIGTSHCGAGCAVADVVTELALGLSGFTLWNSTLLTSFAADFVAAWLAGIAFQYFAIRPMQPALSRSQALVAAVRADTLSILAFQVGMYAIMALAHHTLHFEPLDVRYWLVMQGAMIAGFATAYPMNGWLIQRGLKESM